MRASLAIVTILVTACSGTGVRVARPAPGPGAVAGLVRSAQSGLGVQDARVVLRRPGSLAPVQGVSDATGAYYIAELPPGPYLVSAYLDQVPIGEQTVTIEHDKITGLDFAVGATPDMPIDLNAPSMAPLWRYKPPGADPVTGAIEGTVSDTRRERLPGAVISIIRDGEVAAEQTFTDDHGRFQVAGLSPGSYTVSAYYSIVMRAQMEVRRNRVRVGGGEVVVVPLWLETDTW